MTKIKHNPSNNFEVFVYITITEECHKISMERKYASLNAWGEYIRQYLVSDAKLNAIVKDLPMIYLTLSNMYGLTVEEISKFVLIYFKQRLWIEYYPLLKERFKYSGEYYNE